MFSTGKEFARRLLDWYREHRRDLPWRPPLEPRKNRDQKNPLDPYFVLVSEAMLQQTQVATVIPYFNRFIERFPTAAALADADPQDVLRLWQGLGYYSRARNLQKAAQVIARDLNGVFPRSADELMQLPGVGRYTAGAVASIAFDQRAPIVDGNVVRVLCRLDKITDDPRSKDTLARLWQRAEELLPDHSTGDFNSALMELGATVCTPRNPRCLFCPVRDHCEAHAAGIQEQIPPPKKAKENPLERRATFCIEHAGRYLVEQRPATGRWAGMWQFVTVIAAPGQSPAQLLRSAVPFKCTAPQDLGAVTHALTHRRYEFAVYRTTVSATAKLPSVTAPRA